MLGALPLTSQPIMQQFRFLQVEKSCYRKKRVQARSRHKMTGGAERVAHINSPLRFGSSVKAYFLVHVRSLHLSTIPSVLVYNFLFVLTLTK